MPFIFKPRVMTQTLQARGYDAFTQDGVVVGRLEQGAVRQIWIDRGGTLRYQVTRLAREGRTERVARAGRLYRVSHEEHAVVNVWTELQRAEELATALDAVETLVGRETVAPTDEPPLPSYEASTDLAPPLADETRMDATSDDTPKDTHAAAPTGTDRLTEWLKRKLE